MTLILGFATVFMWTLAVPLTLLIALILFIVGLSTDDENKKLRKQRLRLALWFALIPLAVAVLLTLLTLLVTAITGGTV